MPIYTNWNDFEFYSLISFLSQSRAREQSLSLLTDPYTVSARSRAKLPVDMDES